MESQASPVNPPGVPPGTFLASCSKLKSPQHHVKFLYAPGTHLSFAGSIPQRGSSALEEVPVDPVVSEGVGVHNLRGTFHPRPRGTDCGIYSRFVNRDLTSGKFRIDSRSRDAQHQREVFLVV